MKIYQMRTAPNPRRVRIFLAEKNIEGIEYVEIDLQKGENLTPEFRKISPYGLVPVLQLDDGSSIAETVAISRYFEEIQPEPPLFGRNPKEKAVVEQWNRYSDMHLMMATGMCFQHTSEFFAKLKTQVPEWGELCRGKVREAFALLENHFSGNEYLAGDYYSIADISTYCAVDFNRVNQIRPGDEHPHLKRWYDSMKSRKSASA